MASNWEWREALASVKDEVEALMLEYPWLVVCTVVVVLLSPLLWMCLRKRNKVPDKIEKLDTSVEEEGGDEEEEEGDNIINRKKDLVKNYGKRMFRKASSEFRHFRRKPRERISIIARRLLNKPELPETQLYREPPDAFLDPDLEAADSNIPSEVLYLLKSVRAFGHFEKPLFMELCKHVETKFVPSGAILFRPGQTDDSIYVVKNGLLKVYIIERDGTELPLKEAGTGDSIHSMLSILNAIIGNTQTFKSVAAKATRDSYVLQVNAMAFRQFFENNPDSLLRMVQITMLRLQRVTFLALNEFLGLGHELINQKPALRGEFSVCKLKHHRHGRLAEPGTDEDHYPRPPGSTHPAADCQDSDSDTALPGKTTSTKVPHSRKADSGHKSLRSSDEKYVRDDDSEQSLTSSIKKEALSLKANESDSNSTSNSNPPISDDSTGQAANGAISPTVHRKTVAIDMSQNECFTHRLLPAVSPEFDNVMDQARVNRRQFSSEGTTPFPSEPPASSISSIPVRFSHFVSLKSSDVLQAATEDLVRIFQLKDDSLLKGRIQLIEVGTNSVLGLEGDQESCVYFIASGRLRIYRLTGDQSKSQDLLYVATPGEFCGVLSALTGEPSFITVMAAVHSYLIAITKTNLYQIMSEQPKAVCGLAYDCVQRLSPIVRQIDFALDWTELEAGRALYRYRQGDEATAAYIILSGRLRSVVRRTDGKKELVDEYGRGEAIGVIEVMTSSQCATTVHAIRDSELACLPAGLLNTIKVKQPQVVSRLIHMLGERILGSYNRLSSYSNPHITSSKETKKHMASNLATVAVVPMTPDVPLSMFTSVLCSAINSIAPALRLTSHFIQQELGSTALESVHEYRLRTWLGHQEDNNRIVIYEADPRLTPWTARCIRQADCILLVGLAEKGPSGSLGQIVHQVETISMRVQKELVLLHRQDVAHPTGTVKWLNALGWLSSYFHVRCPDYFFIKKLQKKDKETAFPPPTKHSDFARLARRLTGTSVGLVLGGGGARGIAHVGAIQAFTEAGVPIDMIGGTSIGACIGALYCEEKDASRVEKRAREFSKKMARYGDKILDLTYPHSAMFTGRAFNRLMEETFHEKQIEDLWIPYFCVTTDITDSKMRVHNSGSLWRYVRASMSLSGYMPPLCDPVDGHLLLDGGYVNNLPADVITAQGAETVIAIDVGSETNNELTNYGDHISGWYLLWHKINPCAKRLRVPNLTEIQSRLAYVSCIRQLEAVKADGSCEYIRPPIDNISTLQFGSYDIVLPLGYHHCRTVISGWQKSEKMRPLFSDSVGEEEREKKRRQHLLEKFESLTRSHSSVRDLAALAAQPRRRKVYSDQVRDEVDRQEVEEEEEEDGEDTGMLGYWSNPEAEVFEDKDSPTTVSVVDNSTGSQVKFTCSDSEL